MVMVGGKPLISTTTTTAIGRTIARNNPNVVGAFSGQGAKLGTTALQIGENFSYNRKTTNNKAAGAIGQTAGVTDPKGSIGSASASIALNNGVATGTSTASVKRVALDPLPGVAVGLVNDPVTVTPDTSSPSTSVSVTIGSPGNLLSLQASDVSDSASVLYELAEGDQMLLALEIDLDNTTSSLQNVGFTFLAFDPVDLGFGSMSQSDYLKNVLLPFLTFDDSSHTLSETAPILVSNGPFLLSGTNSVDFTWNYGAVAGATVPEPPSALLILSGLGSLIASKALRSRTCWNCAGK
jgi:hypothetical protein